jgi:endonuclease/exonuclease/phosphatase family metal-dependent hydrolase
MPARVWKFVWVPLQSLALGALLSGAAAAQTTLTLPAADATLQGGTYQNTNLGGSDLATRASGDPTWIRHALLKFDTHTTIPAGSAVNSARLTLTVKGGGTETRTIAAYCVPESFDEHQTTWRLRKGSLYWRDTGGTTNHRHAAATVTGTRGSSVSFDVTAIAREAMATSSRYTRVLLVDTGASSKGSLRYYYSNEAGTTSVRPRLVVSYGGSGSGSTTQQTSGTARTLTLPAADATLRGGAYQNTNYGSRDLVTRASGDPTWMRRALLKFDTHTTIPSGSPINSAKLTVTVKGGYNGETRTVSAYCVPESFDEHQTTWRLRKGTLYWREIGGTTNHRHATARVTGTVGSQVTFDVTAITREAMATSSRYTRILLVDEGASSKGSLKYYHSNESSSTSARPRLVVSYGGSTTTDPDPSPDPSTSSATLKVLEWNIHQGYGTDGKNNIDRVVNWIVKLSPQLIALNEVMKYSTNNQPQQLIDKLKARTGQTWYYHWAQKWGATSGEGVAVLSRYPFADTDTDLLSYQRSVALVRVVVNGRTVNFAATHLDHQSDSYRLTQVKELKSYLSMFAQQRLVAGDFNKWPGTTEINEMAKDYYDAWAVAKSKGTARSYAGNEDGATRNTRIDYVFYSKYATLLSLVSVQVPDTRADMVSDHRPVLATFKVN